MVNEKVLRDQRKESLDKAEAIVSLCETESRGMTADEEKDFTAFMADVKRIEGELDASKRAADAKAALDAAKRYDVPAVVAETRGDVTEDVTKRVVVEDNEQRRYQKGDGFGAVVAFRIRYDAHRQHEAVRDAERQFGGSSPQVRALKQSEFTAGGALLPENFVASEFIELLKAESAFRSAGPRIVELVNGSFTAPRLVTGAAGDWIESEGDNLDTSEPTFGQLKLFEKKYGVVVPFSNDLRRNASLDAVRALTDDLLRTVANDEETQIFNGAGLVGKPKGIYYWTGSGQKAGTSGTTLAQVRTDIRKMKNGLDSNNVPYRNRAFFMHSRTMNYMGWDLVDGNSNFAFPSLQNAGGATLGGDRVYRDNNLSITLGGGTESQIFYVEMSECFIGQSMAMEVEIINNAVYSQSGTIRSGVSRDESVLRLIRKMDFGMRHTQSAFIIETVTYGA